MFEKTLSVTQELLVMHQVRLIIALEKIYHMLPSDMNLNIKSGTVGYNNKFLVSDGMFSLRENSTVNTLEMEVSATKVTTNYYSTETNYNSREEESFLDIFSCWSLRNMAHFLIKKDIYNDIYVQNELLVLVGLLTHAQCDLLKSVTGY